MKLGLGMKLRQRFSGISAYAAYSLALPFKTAATDGYWVGGVKYATLPLVPGYAYTRAGAKGEQSSLLAVEQFAANDPGIPSGIGFWSRAAATNLLLNAGQSATLATQTTPALTADPYTISFIGTGSVALSGSFTGSLAGTGANDRVNLTFTPTAAALTVTVTGSVTYSGLIAGSNRGPIIATGAATAATGADALEANDTADAADQLFWVTMDQQIYAALNGFMAEWYNSANSDRVSIYSQQGYPTVQVVSGGSAVLSQQSAAAAGLAVITVLVRRLGGNWRAGFVKAGVLTWSGADTAGAFPAGMTKLAVGKKLAGGDEAGNPLPGVFRKLGTFATDAEVLAAVA